MTEEVMTYEKIINKYPETLDDILLLKRHKNNRVKIIIITGVITVIITYLLCKLGVM